MKCRTGNKKKPKEKKLKSCNGNTCGARDGGNQPPSKNGRQTTDAETTREAARHNGHRKQTDREELTSLVRTAPLTLLDLFFAKDGRQRRKNKEHNPSGETGFA